MPFAWELCGQLVSPCWRAHIKQQPELKLEKAEAMVYDLDAQTGLLCPACHQSFPTSLLLNPAHPKTGDYDDVLVNMSIKVLLEGGSAPTPWEQT